MINNKNLVRLIDRPNIKFRVINPSCITFNNNHAELCMIVTPVDNKLFKEVFIKPEMADEYDAAISKGTFDITINSSIVEPVPEEDDANIRYCQCDNLDCDAWYSVIEGTTCSECHIGIMKAKEQE
ncbi:TPA: hypothetical protein ACX6RX_003173 [Photobacterium damselae]